VNNYNFTLLNDTEKLFIFDCDKTKSFTYLLSTKIQCSK